MSPHDQGNNNISAFIMPCVDKYGKPTPLALMHLQTRSLPHWFFTLGAIPIFLCILRGFFAIFLMPFIPQNLFKFYHSKIFSSSFSLFLCLLWSNSYSLARQLYAFMYVMIIQYRSNVNMETTTLQYIYIYSFVSVFRLFTGTTWCGHWMSGHCEAQIIYPIYVS